MALNLDLEQYLRELEVLVNTDSGQGNPEGITAVGDFFADRFSSLGWIVEKYDLRPHTGNCTVAKNREADHYDLMLIGHVPKRFRKYGNISTISGAINSCTYVGSAIATYGIAKISELHGWQFTAAIWCAISLIGMLCCAAAMIKWKKFIEI